MQYSVFKMKCLECGTLFYSDEDSDEFDKCPMDWCTEGYGTEEDEIIYEVTVDPYTGVTSMNRIPENPDVIKIK